MLLYLATFGSYIHYFHIICTYVLHKITEVVSPLNGLPQGLALSADLINLLTLVRQLSSEGCQLFLPLFALLPSNHFLGRMLGQISEVQQLT